MPHDPGPAPVIAPGPRNLITDVDGITVGHAGSTAVRSGTTVLLTDTRAVAAADVRGGAPGTRETDLLDPSCLVDTIDAVVLSGGSSYGLDAASGAVAWLGARDRGFRLGATPRVSPIVPGAVLFDLANGGDKAWGEIPPYRAWGIEACENAAADFALGNVGAGMGALVGDLKGGLGSASAIFGEMQVGAMVAVNAFGSAVAPGTTTLWAAPYELADELGHQDALPANGAAAQSPFAGCRPGVEGTAAGANTTLGILATNLVLTASEARRIAIMAQDGLARALRPIHSHVDGDTIFVVSTGKVAIPETDRLVTLLRLGAMAADTVTRAAARGVYAADDLGGVPGYRTRRAAG
ncbi:P1 family peptidase [Acuticoccus sp. I52.16.1]|uniref:P1 family peptidase n=1 Tax=Acuticoccus sp. I52.16.1 TaxID=2928472 RepID=UPI001FD49C4A|nr:P1 family peptidase [Acuticoccus sp. I52.16.1]UOM33013.1 P1 family peptidase [Acuticoccus sp. I52.16.1]